MSLVESVLDHLGRPSRRQAATRLVGPAVGALTGRSEPGSSGTRARRSTTRVPGWSTTARAATGRSSTGGSTRTSPSRSRRSWPVPVCPSRRTRSTPSRTPTCVRVASTPVARLVDMNTVRVECSRPCFPYVTRFAGQMFLEAKDKDLALRCVRAYNDWMIDEWCGDSGGRLVPVTLVPLWDAEVGGGRGPTLRGAGQSRHHVHRDAELHRPPVDPRPRPALGPAVRWPATRRASCWGCTSGRGRRWPTSARTPPGRRPPRSTFTAAEVSLTEWLCVGQTWSGSRT